MGERERRYMEKHQTNNSPSYIHGVDSSFPKEFYKYTTSRLHSSKDTLGMNGSRKFILSLFGHSNISLGILFSF